MSVVTPLVMVSLVLIVVFLVGLISGDLMVGGTGGVMYLGYVSFQSGLTELVGLFILVMTFASLGMAFWLASFIFGKGVNA